MENLNSEILNIHMFKVFPFCECSIDILSTIVTYDEFSSWNNQILAGKHPTGEVVSKMMSVGKKVVIQTCQPK